MKNIHVIPTDKPSRLYYNKNGRVTFSFCETIKENTPLKPCYNIYITSDEEIKKEDWVLWLSQNKIIKCEDSSLRDRQDMVKKIIFTTDQDLIKDGVQAIDDEFLEWFVKNPSCEFVEVEKEYITPLGDIVKTCYDNERLNYKIIIPKTTQEIIDEDFAGGLNMGQIISKEEIDRMNAQLSDSFEYKGRVIPKEEPKQDLEKEMFELEQELDIPSHLRWHNSKPKQETLEEHNYLQGFINQFEEGGEHQELSNDDWTVSRFLEWLKHNNFKIVKDVN